MIILIRDGRRSAIYLNRACPQVHSPKLLNSPVSDFNDFFIASKQKQPANHRFYRLPKNQKRVLAVEGGLEPF